MFALVSVAVALLVSGAPGASGQRVANPSTFTLTVHTATLQIRDNTFDFSDARQPQCSDGVNNDTDLLGGAPQDNGIDFPADGHCASAADDSEVVGGLQPLNPVRLVGTVGANAAWNVATSGVQVPQIFLFARIPVLGASTITVTTSATHAPTGTLNPLTGFADIRLRLRIDIDGSGLGGDCHVGDSGNPIDLNVLSTANTPGGVPYNADAGTLGMANHTFAVPGASGCSTFPVNVNNEINGSLGLPSPSGQNHGIFSGDFPSNAKPLRAITANLSATATVACRPVDFSAAGTTSTRPVASYAFDDTNNGSFEQTGLGTTRSVTFTTAGTRTARLRVTDDQGDFHERLRTYTVGTNLSPSAPSQTKPRSGSGDPVPVTLAGTDPEGGPVTYGIVTPPANGSVSGTAPNLTYTPNSGYGGPDSFTYSVTDDCANTSTGTVTFAVNRVPVANPQTVGTNQEVPVNITIGATDGDGDIPTLAVTTQPANGTLSGTVPNLTYTPDPGFFGADSFQFQASDAFDTSAPATVTINVAQNNAPTADAQSVTTDEDTPVGITLTAGDVDGDSLTYATTSPANGTLSGTAPNLIYTPNEHFHGSDSFDFTVEDGKGGTDTATVSITVDSVNDPPVADDQTVNAQEGDPVAFTLDVSDADGDALSYTQLTPPANGVVTGSFPNFTYTPAPGFIGTDTLAYEVDDLSGGADTASVTFVVIEQNDPPTAGSQVVSTKEDLAVAIVLSGSDPEGGALDFDVTGLPTHGSLAGTAPNLTYTPDADYSGPDSITFTVTDDVGQTTTGTVAINVLPVNDAPIADGQLVTTAEDTPVAIALTATDVDTASVDLQYQITSLPAHGTLSGSGANVTYTPAANDNGPDSFTFRVRDPHGATGTATIDIDVTPVNDAPKANAQSASVLEDGSRVITLTASDAEGEAITFGVSSGPSHGTLGGTGATRTYTPAANYSGFDSFTFTASDPSGGTGSAVVTIAVLGANDAPTAQAQTVGVVEDTPRAITLGGTDPDGDALTYTVESGPTHGSLAGTAPSLTYTPHTDYVGPDSFTFRVRDASGATGTAIVSLTVQDAPIVTTRIVANPAVARLQGLAWFYPNLSATLTRTDTDAPLPGKVVQFVVQGRLVCSAVTAANGVATCGGSANSVLRAGSYTAQFSGDNDYAASAAAGTVI